MKNAKKVLGFTFIAVITLMLLMIACENSDGPDPKEKPFVPPPPIEMPLKIKRWGSEGNYMAHQWESDYLLLSNYTRISPKRGDVLKFKISGTSDKAIKYAMIQVFQAHNILDDDNRIYLGGSRVRQNIGTNFTNATFNFILSSDINLLDGNLYVQLVNLLWEKDPDGNSMFDDADKLTDDILDDTVIANISNFTMTIEKIVVEEMSYYERWNYFASEDSTAKLTHFSIDNENIVKATVAGTPEKHEEGAWNAWKINLQYYYNAKTDTNYIYEFKARTDTDTYWVNVQYYENNDDEVYLSSSIEMTTSWQTFKIIGRAIPKGGTLPLIFQLARDIGTVYIKDVTVTESHEVYKTITVTGLSAEWATLLVYDEYQVAYGWGERNGNNFTFSLNDEYTGELWSGSGSYYIIIDCSEGWYYYTNGQPIENGLQEYNITSKNSTISFNKFALDEGGGGVPPPPPIGEISGTITLTGVPSPAPQVFLSVNGYNYNKEIGDYYYQCYGGNQINLSSGYSNISWSIPLYGDDRFPMEAQFRLNVQSASGEYSVSIPVSTTINNANAGGIALGSVNIGSITLNGTINVTLDGQRVPNVEIRASCEGKDSGVTLNSPNSGASWSITMGAPTSNSTVNFYVEGYDANGYRFFSRDVSPASPVQVNNSTTTVSGIVLNLGDIPNPFTPVSPSPLTANTWKDGEITNDGDVDWYTISVTSGTRYYLWWNDSYEGNDTKTLDIDVYALYNNTSLIWLGNNDSAWNTPVSFTASSTGTVYVRVRAYSGWDSTGTYTIVYNTTGVKPQ